MPGEVAWRDEGGLVHSCTHESVWVDCGVSVLAMTSIADGEPISCLYCLTDDVWDRRRRALSRAYNMPVRLPVLTRR